jgi:hypothetical protein
VRKLQRRRAGGARPVRLQLSPGTTAARLDHHLTADEASMPCALQRRFGVDPMCLIYL